MKKSIILIHGALGAGAQLEFLLDCFSDTFEVHNLTLNGHGGQQASGPYSIPRFADQVLAYLDSQAIEKAHFFGYSMGGYVALWLARHHTERVERIITLGTKLEWSPEIYSQQARGLNPEKIEAKVPAFAQALQQLHAPLDWKEVVRQTDHLMKALAFDQKLDAEDFKAIRQEVLLLLGDQDRMVTEAETTQVANWLPNGSMQILVGVPHPIEQLDRDKLTNVLRTLLHEM